MWSHDDKYFITVSRDKKVRMTSWCFSTCNVIINVFEFWHATVAYKQFLFTRHNHIPCWPVCPYCPSKANTAEDWQIEHPFHTGIMSIVRFMFLIVSMLTYFSGLHAYGIWNPLIFVNMELLNTMNLTNNPFMELVCYLPFFSSVI